MRDLRSLRNATNTTDDHKRCFNNCAEAAARSLHGSLLFGAGLMHRGTRPDLTIAPMHKTGDASMRDTSRAGFAALALVFSVALTGSVIAQTSDPTPAAPDAPSAIPGAPQGSSAPSPDQVQAFIKELGSYLSQPGSGVRSGFQPSVGASVPQDLKTDPVPPGAAAAMPAFKDHHIAKTDDQTIVIVDPVSRQVVGVIAITADSSTVGQGNPKSDSDTSSGASSGGDSGSRAPESGGTDSK
jgi:hypothetical protein